jgi:Zn-finger nucleic acid-binding protein
MPKKGPVCDYCGKRNSLNFNTFSKIEIKGKNKNLDCPVCKVSFDNINIGSNKEVIIQHCNQCDGTFIKENILQALVEKKTIDRKKFDHLMVTFVQNNPRHELERNTKYRLCPVCKKTMNRYNYAAVSGIILDKCFHQHGIWLDGGELRQILEWRNVGGHLKKQKKEDELSANIIKPSSDASYENLRDFLTWSSKVDYIQSKNRYDSRQNESLIDIILRQF